MKISDVETDLSIGDFSDFFVRNKIGRLYLPNCGMFSCDPDISEYKNIEGFTIRLDALYQLSTDWKINKIGINPDEFIAMISFGDSIRFPNAGSKKVEWSYRKYLFFGPEVKESREILTKSVDTADFLVLTEQSTPPTRQLEPRYGWYKNLYEQGIGTYCQELKAVFDGGIKITYMNRRNFVDSSREDKSVQEIINEGIPVFFDAKRFNECMGEIKIEREPKRRLWWQINESGVLSGRIR